MSSIHSGYNLCDENVYSIVSNAKSDDLNCDKNEKKYDSHKRTVSKKLAICIGFSKYEVVRRVIRKLRYEEVGEKDNWNMYWTDGFITPDKMFHLKEYQKINHFPGMIEICRKDSLARNVNRLLKLFPDDFDIIPRTWCLPSDVIDFQSYCRNNKYQNFILKPEASCQGKGILITQNVKNLKLVDGMVCQVYINHPFLVDEYKFDLRIYVLVTSIEPLRIYAYNEGLVRFTTVKYEEPNQKNINNIFMHLTNYTVQKESSNFIKDNEYMGTKRRFSVLNRWFHDHGYNIKKIWQDIDDVIVKTLISIQGTLRHNYRSAFPNHTTVSACFEILGFDIILDDQLQPLLIEVNHSPSFNTDSQIDRDVKDSLLIDTFRLLNLSTIKESLFYKDHSRLVKRRLYSKKSRLLTRSDEKAYVLNLKQKVFELEQADIGNFRLLFPSSNCRNYDKFIRNSISLFNETVSYRARLKCAHKLRDNIRKKQRKIDAIKFRVAKKPTLNAQYLLQMSKALKPIEMKILEKESAKLLCTSDADFVISDSVNICLEDPNVLNKVTSVSLFQNIFSCLDVFFLSGDHISTTYQNDNDENPTNNEEFLGLTQSPSSSIGYISIASYMICEENNNHQISMCSSQINW